MSASTTQPRGDGSALTKTTGFDTSSEPPLTRPTRQSKKRICSTIPSDRCTTFPSTSANKFSENDATDPSNRLAPGRRAMQMQTHSPCPRLLGTSMSTRWMVELSRLRWCTSIPSFWTQPWSQTRTLEGSFGQPTTRPKRRNMVGPLFWRVWWTRPPCWNTKNRARAIQKSKTIRKPRTGLPWTVLTGDVPKDPIRATSTEKTTQWCTCLTGMLPNTVNGSASAFRANGNTRLS
mmetsp:Transcript_961/g.2194  ORF Transcript_961/g.2194 Transcript_961/m.2194 type:complete len:234 (+) Transcript_961:316-1017(+)